jgi:Holliday junction resolvasome RuvABC endonuclease subunit
MPSAAALFPVFGAVLACLPNELEVWDITPAQWRHGLGLKGNATKDECAIVVDDLRGAGSPDWPQDPIDAYAVAYYTRELNRRGIALDDARQKQLAII